jgi:putative ABC transport system permease protein
VAIVMIQVMRRIFGGEGLEITFHITPRSLVISYSIGVVLTFLTVAFSSWRIGNLNIVSAIRDVPDPVLQKPRPSFRSPLSLVRWFFIKAPGWRTFFRDGLLTVAAGLGIAGGVMLFFLAAAVYGGGAAGGIAAVVLGIVGGIVITICAVVVLVLLNNMFQAGPLCLTTGIVLMYTGISLQQAFPFGAGLTLFALGLALTALAFGMPGRPVWTTMGLVLLFFWLLLAGNNLPGASKLKGDVEMFFLSGVTMVLSGTFVLIYNADLMLRGLTLLGGRFSSLVPSIRTAVAYPLANKFRTGMTIAMISLVMFALVMMSTMNENFGRVFLNESARGGFDIIATENPGNPIDDLAQQLRDDGAGDTAEQIAGVDKVEAANRQTSAAAEMKTGGLQDKDYDTYPIWGVSQAFARDTTLKFQGRATGFDSDRAVWDALASNPDYAVVDAFSVSGGGGFGDGSALISSIEQTDRTFDPVPVSVRDLASGRTRTVQVIGVIAVEGSGLFNGLFLSQSGFDEIFASPESSVHYVRVQPGADANDVAHAIERTLLRQGVQADSLKKIIDDFQAQNRSFLYLIQGFMGIGLFVGIAAIGVIAFRTVVERRQQIGMLRAIGYSRRAVALSFIMESTFTAVLGVFSGVALGLLLAYQLVKTDDFIPGGIDSFYIPWVQILFIGGLALVASLLMTIVPSRQASGIPIAEALRYE